MSYFDVLCNDMRLMKDLLSSFLQLKERNSDKSKITGRMTQRGLAWVHQVCGCMCEVAKRSRGLSHT